MRKCSRTRGDRRARRREGWTMFVWGMDDVCEMCWCVFVDDKFMFGDLIVNDVWCWESIGDLNWRNASTVGRRGRTIRTRARWLMVFECVCVCCCREMGVFFSWLFLYFGDCEVWILVLGLDNVGKTTILYRL